MPKQQTDTSFSVDDGGFLKAPNLHDGFVDGILKTGKNAMTVLLRSVEGQTFSMQLIGVEAFVCDNFQLGNIILSVQIVSGTTPDNDAITSVFVSPHTIAANEFHERHAEFLKRKIDEVGKGALKLVSIDPSYGCSLRALYREISISPNR